MKSEYGNDIITISDEQGNELAIEHLDSVEHNGTLYMAFIPVGPDLEDRYELIILKPEFDEQTGEEMLVTLEDEQELETLFQIFSDRLEDLFEDEEDPEGELLH